METNPRTFVQRPRRAAAALVMTLITLSILVILLVGFLATMLTERRAATAFEDTGRVKLIAAGAVSHAIDILRTNIPEPARLSESPATAPGENWVVNPGRLTVIEEGEPIRHIPLHTGEVTSAPPADGPRDAESVDLNQPLPGDTVPAITGLAGEVGRNRPVMRVKWENLLRDPSAAASAENKLTGRYAFWMDDENARINFNTAVGKPAPGADGQFDAQLKAEYLTPLFKAGTNAIRTTVSTPALQNIPDWALGRPSSVNLDVLFDSPNQLLRDRLVDNVFLQGYSRYPEAILDYTTLKGTAQREWYEKSRYYLTPYSRSPEFNAFNRSRLFTTFIPTSLEGGPSYQLPFIYDPTGAFLEAPANLVLHLNSLLGSFGMGNNVDDDDGSDVAAGSLINEAQIDMLMAYLRRHWPGYSRSFVQKYGEAGCRQLALNAALMARMATTQLPQLPGNPNSSLVKFSAQYALRTTSVNPVPRPGDEDGKKFPEATYWRYSFDGKEKLFLPQMPGPQITEVRLFVKSVSATPAAPVKPGIKVPVNGRYLQYWYEVEYYMPPFSPVLSLMNTEVNPPVCLFPTRMDYFEVEAPFILKDGKVLRQQFGPKDTSETAGCNWNAAPLKAFKIDWTETMGPTGSGSPNRLTKTSNMFVLGENEFAPAYTENGVTRGWSPYVFDADQTPAVTVNFRLRAGMGANAAIRVRQMIPLGETSQDTLKATFTVSLLETRDQAVSWQINDPQLSSDLAQWEANKEGPGDPALIGTPKLKNRHEPAEGSAEKSKFRYLQRAFRGSMIAGYEYDRPDELDPASRVSSPGYWSLLHTGMQANVPAGVPAAKPWRTLDFGPENRSSGPLVGNDASPPDWLLLDLLGPTFPMASDQFRIAQKQPDQFSTASYMNSTAGQINLNSRIYPRTAYFNPPERTKPLQAVFQNLPELDARQVAANISAYQTDEQVFDYVGEVANVAAVAGTGATPWKTELALRNMAGVLTTKSNTFGVWGVAQVVQKVPKNTGYAEFEKGDQVVAEKRFYALVERYVWAGREGVPGNGHINKTTGKWDRLAIGGQSSFAANFSPDTLFRLPGSPPLIRSGPRLVLPTSIGGTYPEFDGPERVGMNGSNSRILGSVVWSESKLEDAYNPPQALIKYRVVSFKYLDQ